MDHKFKTRFGLQGELGSIGPHRDLRRKGHKEKWKCSHTQAQQSTCLPACVRPKVRPQRSERNAIQLQSRPGNLCPNTPV